MEKNIEKNAETKSSKKNEKKSGVESFETLGLGENLLRAVKESGYENPTPIQALSIPHILKGRDIFGCAQTGTGKTAAFALPIMRLIEKKSRYPQPLEFRALVLAPTRELVEQIDDNIKKFAKYSQIFHCKIFGGVSQVPQVKALRDGVDILTATPGRLLDLYAQRRLSFRSVEFLVLDEADRMLDMGFLPDIRKISAALPKHLQTMLFSATLGGEIETLARAMVKDPVRIDVSPESPTVNKIEQKVCFVDRQDKGSLLKDIISKRLQENPDSLSLVFCRTKHGANKVAKILSRSGLEASPIHGDKSQSFRRRTLGDFKSRTLKTLVATDIAARGIDVKDMSLVINYDIPETPETYVHRIGRTARADASGLAISLCSQNELPLFKAVQKFIKKTVPIYEENPYHSPDLREKLEGTAAPAVFIEGAKKRKEGASKRTKNRNFSNKGASEKSGGAKKGNSNFEGARSSGGFENKGRFSSSPKGKEIAKNSSRQKGASKDLRKTKSAKKAKLSDPFSYANSKKTSGGFAKKLFGKFKTFGRPKK